MKLLLENWRRFLNENKAPKEDEVKAVLEKLGLTYTKWLGSGYYGSVVQVENPEAGERRAVKIVADRADEEKIYAYFMNNRDRFGEYEKYLAEV